MIITKTFYFKIAIVGIFLISIDKFAYCYLLSNYETLNRLSRLL